MGSGASLGILPPVALVVFCMFGASVAEIYGEAGLCVTTKQTFGGDFRNTANILHSKQNVKSKPSRVGWETRRVWQSARLCLGALLMSFNWRQIAYACAASLLLCWAPPPHCIRCSVFNAPLYDIARMYVCICVGLFDCLFVCLYMLACHQCHQQLQVLVYCLRHIISRLHVQSMHAMSPPPPSLPLSLSPSLPACLDGASDQRRQSVVNVSFVSLCCLTFECKVDTTLPFVLALHSK